MKKITRWSPDTCDCVIEYEWDTDDPQETRAHTLSRIVSKCKDHEGVIGDELHFVKVLDENRRKNYTLADVVSNFPALSKTDENGNVLLKDGVLEWNYDASRVLQINIPSLTALQKVTLQNIVNSKLGSNKVKIN